MQNNCLKSIIREDYCNDVESDLNTACERNIVIDMEINVIAKLCVRNGGKREETYNDLQIGKGIVEKKEED